MHAGKQAIGSSSASFPGILESSWIRSGVAWILSTPYGVQELTTGIGLIHYSQALAFFIQDCIVVAGHQPSSYLVENVSVLPGPQTSGKCIFIGTCLVIREV